MIDGAATLAETVFQLILECDPNKTAGQEVCRLNRLARRNSASQVSHESNSQIGKQLVLIESTRDPFLSHKTSHLLFMRFGNFHHRLPNIIRSHRMPFFKMPLTQG